ncbi:hypothetical protein MRB53_041200 [Persea americana]|nr:hypothetical protein MRB53_041200 [Persea americana]
MDPDGTLVYANDVWHAVTQWPKGDMTPMGWMAAFYMEEVANAETIWTRLTQDKVPVTFESRLRRPWVPPGGDEEDKQHFTWSLARVAKSIRLLVSLHSWSRSYMLTMIEAASWRFRSRNGQKVVVSSHQGNRADKIKICRSDARTS